MKTINIILSICLISSLLLIEEGYGQYPFHPTNTQHKIAGTIGEERGGKNRYHYGLDFSGFPAGTDVYAVETGLLRKKDNHSFAIGRFGYIHVLPNSYIKGLNPGDTVTAGTLIGILQDLKGAEHVHLQEATTNIYSTGNTDNNFKWENQTFNWINPILSRHPADTESPVIDRITLYRQGDKNNTDLKDILKIYGAYDLMVETKDARILPDGTGQWGGVAPLKIQYKIKDNNNKTLLDWAGIDFSNVPPNGSASTVFGKNSNYNTPKFEYIITNDPFSMPFDKALNFRRHISSDITTDIPIKAKYQDGIKFTIAARSCDQADNCATETIPASGTYELDNFKPYITDVNIRYNNELLYQAVRAGNEGSSDPDDGFVMNRIHEYPISPGQLLPNTLTVEVLTSEPMQNVRMSYKKASQITVFPNPVAMTKDITDNLRWTGSIATFNPGDCYDVQFKGQDLSGNEVINVYATTNQNANNTKMMIPTRKGAGVQDWNHNPTYTGEDRISFCIKDCDYKIWSGSNTARRGGDEACKALSAVSSTVLYTSCIQATIVLGGAGFNPSDFTIRWTDAQGNPLTLYNNLEMIEVSSAGIYCFEVEAIEDCCTIRGCAEVLPSMMEDAAFDLSADITHSCTPDANDGKIDLHIEGGIPPFHSLFSIKYVVSYSV